LFNGLFKKVQEITKKLIEKLEKDHPKASSRFLKLKEPKKMGWPNWENNEWDYYNHEDIRRGPTHLAGVFKTKLLFYLVFFRWIVFSIKFSLPPFAFLNTLKVWTFFKFGIFRFWAFQNVYIKKFEHFSCLNFL
jgi:hypothetical protein